MKWLETALKIFSFIGVSVLVNRILVMERFNNVEFSKNFKLGEFVRTSTGLDNIPPQNVINNLRTYTNATLQPLSDILGKLYPLTPSGKNRPIIVTSGYRSPVVNTSTKYASNTSWHPLGWASDIRVIEYTSHNGKKYPALESDQVIKIILEHGIPYNELIDERLWKQNTLLKWYLAKHLHWGWKPEDKQKEILIATNSIEDTKPKYNVFGNV